jgi:uncharacterized OsmC-like protein
MAKFRVDYIKNMTIKTTMNDGELVFYADQPVKDGGDGKYPTPSDYFLASIPMCASTYAIFFYKRHNLDMTGHYIDVEYSVSKRKDEKTGKPKRVYSPIILKIYSPNVPEDLREKYETFVNKCIVANSVETTIEIQKEFIYV